MTALGFDYSKSKSGLDDEVHTYQGRQIMALTFVTHLQFRLVFREPQRINIDFADVVELPEEQGLVFCQATSMS